MFWNNKTVWYGLKLKEYVAALESGDYSVIPWIFCVFSENHSEAKKTAADALCSALKKMSFDDLVQVDEQMRQTTSMEWSIDWRKLSIDSFFTCEMGGDARHAVVVFASFNPNGFIRERAVRMMKDYCGTLPFAILRLNDWVTQIQDAAAETVNYRLSHLSEGELIASLSFADKLNRSGRVRNVNTYIKHIFTTLTSSDYINELIIGLNSANIRTRRICTTALLDAEQPRYDLLAERLKSETDPFLRSTIFRKFISVGHNLDAIAERFLTDKYPLNRILAFQYICETNRIRALQWAEKLLLDKSAALRDNSRFYFNKNIPGFDYRAYYKSHLNDSTTQAILGLGETGISEDADVIENYLNSEKNSAVRAAMIAMMRLNSEKYVAFITDLLSDDRMGIVKTACNLIKKTAAPDYSKVMVILRTTQYANTRQKCFSVLLTAGKWQRLIYILDVLEIGHSDMRETAMSAIDRWVGCYNRSYIAAAPVQIEKIIKKIEQLENIFPSKLKQQLLFLLR